jgi:hypothetical protein
MTTDPYFQQAELWPYHQKILAVATNAETANSAAFAYDRLVTYKQAAAMQMTRIWEAAAEAGRFAQQQPSIAAPQLEQVQFLANYGAASAALIYETHFYFIAWFNCSEMLQTVTTDHAFLPARKSFNKHKKLFQHYGNARHSFEHFTDRLPGGKENKKVVEVVQGLGASPSKIMFGFANGNYEHSNQKWDITQAGLLKLHAAIDEVLAALHEVVDMLIAEKFPTRA